ncbi:MAG: hypothetical protein Q8R53_01135 [Nanoarchaeota archaeon]|nr:hypothetical protein [Nanoarchaeota archaeon]
MAFENPLSERDLRYLDVATDYKRRFIYVRGNRREQENAIAQQIFDFLAPKKTTVIDRLSLDYTHLPPAVARQYREHFKKRFSFSDEQLDLCFSNPYNLLLPTKLRARLEAYQRTGTGVVIIPDFVPALRQEPRSLEEAIATINGSREFLHQPETCTVIIYDPQDVELLGHSSFVDFRSWSGGHVTVS